MLPGGLIILLASAASHNRPDYGVPYPPPPTVRTNAAIVSAVPAPRVTPAPVLPPDSNDYLWTMQESLDGGTTWVDLLKNLGGNQGAGGTWDFRDSVTNRPVRIRYIRQRGWKN